MPAAFAPIAALFNDFTSKSLPLRGTDMTVVVTPPRVPSRGGSLASFSNTAPHSRCVSALVLPLPAAELGKRGGRCRKVSSGDLLGLCQELCCWWVSYPSLFASHPDSRDVGGTAHHRSSTPEVDRQRAYARRNADKCAFASSHAVAANAASSCERTS